MNSPDAFHKMISYNGKLYVFGGVCVILRASFESQGCPSTEVSQQRLISQTILASMPIGRSGHGVTVLDRPNNGSWRPLLQRSLHGDSFSPLIRMKTSGRKIGTADALQAGWFTSMQPAFSRIYSG